jgi:RNA polymerase sigma-70 factor (ECF subfamily)
MKRSEEQLLLDIARGDKKAFRELYQLYAPALYRLTRRLTANSGADCDEVFQEAMLRIWKKAALFDSAKGKAKSWIYLVATRHCLNAIAEKSSRNKKNESELNLTKSCDSAPGPEQKALENEDIRRLIGLLDRLPEDMKQVIVLRHIEHLGIEEISQIIDIPPGTVKSRIFYGLKKLRSFFFKENTYESQ